MQLYNYDYIIAFPKNKEDMATKQIKITMFFFNKNFDFEFFNVIPDDQARKTLKNHWYV